MGIKKKVKKANSAGHFTTGEVKRYLGSLSEDFGAKVDGIAEQYLSLDNKLDGVVEIVGKLAEDMTVVKQNIEFIKGDLKKKVDYDEFSALERRVAVLERKR
jgi:hypothetical protein